MEYANKIKSPAVILYGDNEIKTGKMLLKNLKSGKETSATIESLSDEIKKMTRDKKLASKLLSTL